MMALPSVLHAAIDFKYRFPPFVQESTHSAHCCRLATKNAAAQRSAKLPLGWRREIHPIV